MLSSPILAALVGKQAGRTVYERSYVESLFDSIAFRYDFLNHVLSFGVDTHWRRTAIQLLSTRRPQRILDAATGTADLAIAAASLRPQRIVGIDISERMLELGRTKIKKRKLENLITLQAGQAEHLPFESSSFDAVFCAFGVRNFEHLEKGLAEFCRVLASGGSVVILEFSTPRSFPMKPAYNFYSRHVLPFLGGRLSGNRDAYEYLPRTASQFPDGDAFCSFLRSAGFTSTQCFPQTGGIASIYVAVKP